MQEDVLWLQTSLTEMGGDWDITRYSMVPHGFSKWGPADSAYHARADGRSWAAMKVCALTRYAALPFILCLSARQRQSGREWLRSLFFVAVVVVVCSLKALFGEYMPLPASSESSMETPSDSHASSLSFGSALMACVALLMAALWN
jgi:hypothetical protein